MSGNAHQRRIAKRAGHVDNTAVLISDVMRRFTYSVPPEAVPTLSPTGIAYLRARIGAFFVKCLQRLRIARANRFGV